MAHGLGIATAEKGGEAMTMFRDETMLGLSRVWTAAERIESIAFGAVEERAKWEAGYTAAIENQRAELATWQARANALLSVLDKAVDMTAAGYVIHTHRGSVAVDQRVYKALGTAVEEYRRLSEMEKAAGVEVGEPSND